MRAVLVIGGGLAGAAAAVHLAGAGRDVCLLERTTGPHDKVCGEFLSFDDGGRRARGGTGRTRDRERWKLEVARQDGGTGGRHGDRW